MAVSGGSTPWRMFAPSRARECLGPQCTWRRSTNERALQAGDEVRNLTHLHESLLEHAPLRPDQIHAMPVEVADLDAARRSTAPHAGPDCRIAAGFGSGASGAWPDGHTASLVPGDPVLDVVDRDVATTGVYQGHRRMTLTYPLVNRSRSILWLVAGAERSTCCRAFARGGSRHSCRTHCAGSSDPSLPTGPRQPKCTRRRRRIDWRLAAMALPCPPSIWRVTAKPNGR